MWVVIIPLLAHCCGCGGRGSNNKITSMGNSVNGWSRDMGPGPGPVVTGHRTITLDKIFLKVETQVNCAMCKDGFVLDGDIIITPPQLLPCTIKMREGLVISSGCGCLAICITRSLFPAPSSTLSVWGADFLHPSAVSRVVSVAHIYCNQRPRTNVTLSLVFYSLKTTIKNSKMS